MTIPIAETEEQIVARIMKMDNLDDIFEAIRGSYFEPTFQDAAICRLIEFTRGFYQE